MTRHTSKMKENLRATSLRIQIKRKQLVTVDLKFPIFTLTMVDSFIPAKAQIYLTESSIDLPAILKKIEASDYRPQPIIDFEYEEKNFSIWIE